MGRQRMVKPEFFDSESVGTCSIAARLAFIGLWVTSDDFGNQKAQAGRLRLRVFPYDEMTDEDFMALLCELEEVGCIKGYEIDGTRYINIPNFQIYQTVNRPSKSSVPEPPKRTARAASTALIKGWMRTHGALTEHSRSTHGLTEGSVSTHRERKKEGKKEVVVLQQQPPTEDVENCAERGADAVEAAPRPARECGACGGEMQPTNAFVPGTSLKQRRRYWRCAQCGAEEAVDE